MNRARDGEPSPVNPAFEERPAVREFKSAPPEAGEELETGLGSAFKAGQVKGQGGGGFSAVVRPKTGLAGGGQEGRFRLAKLRPGHQQGDAVLGLARQVLGRIQD
jgi:hypothetical protein